MNVAITRARRMLILIGDSDCISSDQRISKLIEWVGTHGEIQSAEEFRFDPNVRFGIGKITEPGQKVREERKQEGKKSDTREKPKKKTKQEKK